MFIDFDELYDNNEPQQKIKKSKLSDNNIKEKLFSIIKDVKPDNQFILAKYKQFLKNNFINNYTVSNIKEFKSKFFQMPVGGKFNKDYWLSRGWTDEESNLKIIEQKNNVPLPASAKSSKIANDVFTLFSYFLKKLYNKNMTEFFGNNNEYFISANGTRYFYDYTNITLNFMIEFQGSYWHNSEDQKKKDEFKKSLAESHNFTLYYINEKSFFQDIINIFEKINFLKS